MRDISFIYRNFMIADRMNNTDLLAAKGLDKDSFLVLFAINAMAKSFESETIRIKYVKFFMRDYFMPMSLYMFNKQMDKLHEENLIWIDTVNFVSITALGTKTINQIYSSLIVFERDTLKPILKTLKSGKMNAKGLLVSKANVKKKKREGLYPYMGVKRVGAHKFESTVRVDGHYKVIGIFTKPMAAAKFRDSYIRKHKLFTLNFSL